MAIVLPAQIVKSKAMPYLWVARQRPGSAAWGVTQDQIELLIRIKLRSIDRAVGNMLRPLLSGK